MIQLDPGSVVKAQGAIAGSGQTTVTIGSNGSAAVPGNGSLLAVSNAQPLIVQREDIRQNNGTLTLLGNDQIPGVAGAILMGTSVVLDTSGTITTGPGVTLTATNVSVAAKGINFGTANAKMGFNVSGTLLPQLEAAQNLTVRAASGAITFTGAVNFAMSQAGSQLTMDSPTLVSATAGNSVTLSAAQINLVNSGAEPATSIAGTAALNLAGADITLGSGDKIISGFSSATFSGSVEVAARDSGSLNAGAANLTFQTPLFLAGAGANQSIVTTGLVNVTDPGLATPTSAAEIGGTLSITGPSIDSGRKTRCCRPTLGKSR